MIIDREIRVTIGGAQINTESAEPGSNARPIQPTPYTRGVERLSLSEYATRVQVSGKPATEHIGDGKAAVLADTRVGQGRLILSSDRSSRRCKQRTGAGGQRRRGDESVCRPTRGQDRV